MMMSYDDDDDSNDDSNDDNYRFLTLIPSNLETALRGRRARRVRNERMYEILSSPVMVTKET